MKSKKRYAILIVGALGVVIFGAITGLILADQNKTFLSGIAVTVSILATLVSVVTYFIGMILNF